MTSSTPDASDGTVAVPQHAFERLRDAMDAALKWQDEWPRRWAAAAAQIEKTPQYAGIVEGMPAITPYSGLDVAYAYAARVRERLAADAGNL